MGALDWSKDQRTKGSVHVPEGGAAAPGWCDLRSSGQGRTPGEARAIILQGPSGSLPFLLTSASCYLPFYLSHGCSSLQPRGYP